MKHLPTRGIHLKADACTTFNCLRDPTPSTSATVAAKYTRPGRSARGYAFTDDVTHYDWLYVGKCTDAICGYFLLEKANMIIFLQKNC